MQDSRNFFQTHWDSDCLQKNKLIKCKFSDGFQKFSDRFEFIKDVVNIKFYYNSPTDLIEFGKIINEKKIEIFSFDELDLMNWTAEKAISIPEK